MDCLNLFSLVHVGDRSRTTARTNSSNKMESYPQSPRSDQTTEAQCPNSESTMTPKSESGESTTMSTSEDTPTPPSGWAPSSTTLTSFTEFHKLPVELRIKVWKQCSISHMVKVDIKRTPNPNRGRGTPQSGTFNNEGLKRLYDYDYKCTATGHFGILAVCRESRDEFLKRNPDFISEHFPLTRMFKLLYDYRS